MDVYTTNPCSEDEWHNSVVTFGYNIKEQLEAVENGSVTIHQQPPKPFTKEALYMLYVILTFVMLAITGTLITAYEYFCKKCQRENNSNGTADKKDVHQSGSNTKSGDKSLKTASDTDWLKTSKSFFKCFCIITNGKKVLETSSDEDPLKCLYGIRFFSTIFVILMHCVAFCALLSKNDPNTLFLDKWYAQYLLHGHHIITAFFVLGGFINAFAFFIIYEKTKGNIPYLLFYLNRFRRITPVYMILLAFLNTLFIYTGSGPIWPKEAIFPVCKDTWWKDVFYITNFWSISYQCMPWAWYLNVDVQLYLISPFFLVPLIKWSKLGYSLIGLAIFGGSLISFILTLQYEIIDVLSIFGMYMHDLNTSVKMFWKYYDILYSKPYTRICPYVIGFLLAQYLYKRRENKTGKNTTLTLICGWIISTVLFHIVVFALFDREVNIWNNAVYFSVNDILFSCSFSWVLYVCLTGQAGFLNRLLTWKYFFPLSRLCFCAYLIHLFVLFKYCLQTVKLDNGNFSSLMYIIGYTFSWTFFLSFVVSLIFEIPISRLFAMFVESKVKREKKE